MVDIYGIVLVYDRRKMLSSDDPMDVLQLFDQHGLVVQNGAPLWLREIAASACSRIYQNLNLDDDRDFTVEAKVPPDGGFLEFQMYGSDWGESSLFAEPDYETKLRPIIRSCLEALISLPGFEFGASFSMSEDVSEETYR